MARVPGYTYVLQFVRIETVDKDRRFGFVERGPSRRTDRRLGSGRMLRLPISIGFPGWAVAVVDTARRKVAILHWAFAIYIR